MRKQNFIDLDWDIKTPDIPDIKTPDIPDIDFNIPDIDFNITALDWDFKIKSSENTARKSN